MTPVVDTELHCLGSPSREDLLSHWEAAASRQPPAVSILESASVADSHSPEVTPAGGGPHLMAMGAAQDDSAKRFSLHSSILLHILLFLHRY